MLKNKLLSAMGGAPANYIEDVFSNFLYTGNGSTQTITNGIDLAGKGGLVWSKGRSVVNNNILVDTVRGGTRSISSNSSNAQGVGFSFTFNDTGYSTGSYVTSGVDFVSWTFRKAPKFFDVVTWVGDGVAGRQISHSLASVPGCIFVKATSATYNWSVYHRGTSETAYNQQLVLNATTAVATSTIAWNSTAPTDTHFTVGAGSNQNESGINYVAYLFAHNAGGFGLTGTDNVISCGSFTTDGSGNSTVDLGYEPQWVMVKRADSTGGWWMFDTMRRWDHAANEQFLSANLSDAEGTFNASAERFFPIANGFQSLSGGLSANATFIYIAIRRGPMKTPTSGTSVFAPVSATPSGATTVTTNFPVDLAINAQRDAGTSGNKVFWDRLRGSSTAAGQGLFSTLTNAEVSYSGNGIGLQSNTTIVDNFWNTLNGATTPVIYWNFRRAPGFFDEVCYTGTGSATTQAHNLGVAPELMIVKRRSITRAWAVYHGNNDKAMTLNDNTASRSFAGWNYTTPTTSVFSLGVDSDVNASAETYVAYLFASCPGVSKVGSYTGTGTTQTINCGFTAGARFVLIKRTDSTGDWYVWDSARGIVAGNDPYLLLNSTAAEVTTTDYVDTFSSGFEISSTAPAAINASGGTFIYLAIA